MTVKTMTVTLDGEFSNMQDFVDSLFDDRDYDGITSALKDGETTAAFTDPRSRGRIVRSWMAAWKVAQGAKCPDKIYDRLAQSDQKLIEFLASYVKTYDLELCYPDLELDGFDGKGRPKYCNKGYQRSKFYQDGKWKFGHFDKDGIIVSSSESTVAKFLSFLFYGAHFVVITSHEDSKKPGKDFEPAVNAFANSNNVDTSKDPVSSHYGLSILGLYWLDIGSNKLPSSRPTILAFLTDNTAEIETNYFMQLEGWQASVIHPSRHNQDFDEHKDTLWNFSTFGACAYSEKRSTPIFLCPEDFKLTIDDDTHMPLYRGAGSKQSWMHPHLLKF